MKKKKYTIAKLNTGDVLMSEVVSTTTKSVNLIRPLMMVSTVTESGYTVVFLKRYLTLTKNDGITINKSSILLQTDPCDELIEYYKIMCEYQEKVVAPDILQGVKNAIKIISSAIEVDQNRSLNSFAAPDDTTHYDDFFDDYEPVQKSKNNKPH